MPLTQQQIESYRQRLQEMAAEVEADSEAGAEARRPVALDQQSVGRLSRMAAMQGQAMAKAGEARRHAMGARVAAALQRIEEGEFGFCTDCGDDIAPARLDLDPTLPRCVSCASGG